MAKTYEEKLADVLVEHSFGNVDFRKEWEKNERALVFARYSGLSDPVVRAVANRVWVAGGAVRFSPEPEWKERDFLRHASEFTRTQQARGYELEGVNHTAARLVILDTPNTQASATVDPTRRVAFRRSRKTIRDELLRVDSITGEFIHPWCITIYPTQAYAQDMGMPLEEAAEIIYRAMLLDADDPVQAWKDLTAEQQKLIDKVFVKAKKVEIYHPDGTHLEANVEGHKWKNSNGVANFPSGEIFTSPRKYSVNGVIKFTKLPQYDHGGPEVSGIELRYRRGKLVKGTAKIGQAYLEQFFEIPGTDYLGEVALGTNRNITRMTRQILLDEKMGGAIHIALGGAYKGLGDPKDLNESVAHWDMIKPMRGGYVQVTTKDNKVYKLTWNDKQGLWRPRKIAA